MPSRRFVASLFFNFLMFFTLAAASDAFAQGIIVPRPCESCPRPPRPVQLPPALPVKSIKLETKINAQVATTHVEQIFRNDSDATLEGTYFFPIPETASVSEFAIWDGERRLVGEVRSREEARRIYDQIVRKQRDPGLLEYAGKDLFQASIFPIPPHADKKLELTYTQVLQAQSGTVSYRYPLGTNHNLVSIGRVSGALEIEGNKPLRNIYSPSHALDVRPSQGGQHARVSFETAGAREPQDFQLFYTLSSEDFGMSLLTHREPGKDGYFLLMISPKDNWAESEYTAKDIVFVIDTSGSMAEEGKMEKARAAMLFGVKTLRADDRFNVISFAGEEHLMESGLIQADERGRARGVAFIQKLQPTGGTNINGAVQAGLKQFDSSDRPKMLIFMTDGLPTVGVTNPPKIIENARTARGESRTRLFTFGVGYDVNTALLDKLASENGGVADYVEPKEDLEIKVSNFFAKVNYPVLTDLALDMGGVETDFMYPRGLPDLFRGAQVTLIGRYRNASDLRDVRLRLSGKSNRETRSFAYQNLRFPANSEENDFLPRLWATRRVGWLMEQIRSNGEARELRDEVVDLGTRYGIVTPYTSYLALEPGFVVDGMNTTANADARNAQPGERIARLRRPPARPMPKSGAAKDSSVGSARAGGGNAPVMVAPQEAMPMPTPIPTTGADAVQQSKQAREQQESLRADDEDRASVSSQMRKVADKTFYLREGVWTDADFNPEAKLPETALAFGSDAYFDLLKRERKLADFFALGERVVVVYKGRVYRVNAATN
ncbi:MAG TPA: VIT and VWA domain-containing protein [Pyrinomonadaceae bacterium]|jgi:Ca-activated chloride channel family protein|nr:VIT and VWA domain-containing protein [Pyrinomonadaceae bacterium]